MTLYFAKLNFVIIIHDFISAIEASGMHAHLRNRENKVPSNLVPNRNFGAFRSHGTTLYQYILIIYTDITL